jgi:integration host factor subunit beta
MGRNKMTRLEITEAVLNDPEIQAFGITQKEAGIIISVLINKLRDSISYLQLGNRIELRGFGTFSIKQRKGGIARNPKTGAKLNVPQRNRLFFKPGREMKDTIAGK